MMADPVRSPVTWQIVQSAEPCQSVLKLGTLDYRCVDQAGHSYAHTWKCGTDRTGYQLKWWDEPTR